MRVTSKPVSEARENRGTGNKCLGGIGGGKPIGTGTYVWVDGVWINTDKCNIKDEPSRGDYGFMRDCNKTLRDYIQHKDPRDREKIKNEYFGKQEEYRATQSVQEYCRTLNPIGE